MIDLKLATEVMLAAQEPGAVVEFSTRNGDTWDVVATPSWDWCREKYRIRKEPVRLPLWKIASETFFANRRNGEVWSETWSAVVSAVIQGFAENFQCAECGTKPAMPGEVACGDCNEKPKPIPEERDEHDTTRECSACHVSLHLEYGKEWPEDERDITCSECSIGVIHDMRIALADAIRRPMGIIPESAARFLNDDDRREAEARRMKYHKEGT